MPRVSQHREGPGRPQGALGLWNRADEPPSHPMSWGRGPTNFQAPADQGTNCPWTCACYHPVHTGHPRTALFFTHPHTGAPETQPDRLGLPQPSDTHPDTNIPAHTQTPTGLGHTHTHRCAAQPGQEAWRTEATPSPASAPSASRLPDFIYQKYINPDACFHRSLDSRDISR